MRDGSGNAPPDTIRPPNGGLPENNWQRESIPQPAVGQNTGSRRRLNSL
ncbi:hypothetical protein [Eikenella longinqua]|nr:hypothetical protein [Eikenella longinqua]